MNQTVRPIPKIVAGAKAGSRFTVLTALDENWLSLTVRILVGKLKTSVTHDPQLPQHIVISGYRSKDEIKEALKAAGTSKWFTLEQILVAENGNHERVFLE